MVVYQRFRFSMHVLRSAFVVGRFSLGELLLSRLVYAQQPESGSAPVAPARPELLLHTGTTSTAAPTPASPAPSPEPAQPARPTVAGEQARVDDALSASWWTKPQPTVELHGYFRTRAELFQNFSLGRRSSSVLPGGDPQYLWPVPLDQSYTQPSGSGG